MTSNMDEVKCYANAKINKTNLFNSVTKSHSPSAGVVNVSQRGGSGCALKDGAATSTAQHRARQSTSTWSFFDIVVFALSLPHHRSRTQRFRVNSFHHETTQLRGRPLDSAENNTNGVSNFGLFIQRKEAKYTWGLVVSLSRLAQWKKRHSL